MKERHQRYEQQRPALIMTIVVLKSSCSPLAPTGRPSPASTNHAPLVDFLATDDEAHNRANGFSTGQFSSTTQPSFYRATAQTAPRPDVAASEKQITSLPLQCDITILPANAGYLSSFDFDDMQAAFVATAESLHPCGTDNVIIVQSDLEGGDRSSHFSLSLTNCWAISGEGDPMLLPVDAVPSTFRFPLRYDGRDLMRGLNRNGYHSTSSKDGKDFFEGHLSFDFTAAWDVYRKSIASDREEKSRLDALKEESEYSVQDVVLQNEATECFAKNSTLRNLDQQTRVTNLVMIVLQFFGVAIIWFGWKIIQEHSRVNQNDRYRVRIADSLPREIRTSSLRSQRQRNVKRIVTPETSPRTPYDVGRAEMTERNHDQTRHENCYLVSLVRHTDTPLIRQQVKNTTEESLRSWYDDYLSPRIDVTQDTCWHESSIDTVGRDETARSLSHRRHQNIASML
ncbi:hypothetical protein HJC23_001487 [Cyclotella cryptica]|uniref:Uncharacterized protein n=1 Tax=Cyclotella cryptica TaxID=29204 RepID=A0ABD3P0E3_9STRA